MKVTSEHPDWRNCHDYDGDNNTQKCMKCGRTLLAKDQEFGRSREWTDKKPICPVQSNETLRELLRDRRWYGYAATSRFYVAYKPYAYLTVTLESLV